MPKFPFIKFFPNDWMAEPTIRVCSVAARGLWMDMLSLMHLSPRRGYLLAATGSPISPEQLARLTGCSADEVTRLLAELSSSGAYSCTDDGIVYSRRMVREEGKREKCSDAGRKGGGNPTFKGADKGRPKGATKGGDKPLDTRGQKLEATPLTPRRGEGEAPGDDEPPESAPGPPGPKLSAVKAAWNAQPKLVPCRVTDPARDTTIRGWSIANPDWCRHWLAVIEFMGRTPHYHGANDIKWCATLTWLTEGSNFAKVCEKVLAEKPRPALGIRRAADNPGVNAPTADPWPATRKPPEAA